MHSKRKKAFRAVVLVVLAAVLSGGLFAGCSSNTDPAQDPNMVKLPPGVKPRIKLPNRIDKEKPLYQQLNQGSGGK